ncbi:MAG: hypothetical protein M1823_001541 [Watsoniomyces obsoletus]|nr:MAG: hypothetical protein M1823_001541 [Watsoniomyces obsoletus]
MFRNRSSSQKPSDELLTSFRQNFPEICSDVRAVDASTEGPGRAHGPGHHGRAASVSSESRDDIIRRMRGGTTTIPEHDELKGHPHDHDPTPRGNQDPWRFTPALLDPNSFAFASLVNQPPAYDTPTSAGGHQAWYHSQAGDLHTPGMALGLGTPLSMPTTQPDPHVGTVVDMHDFSQHHHHHHHHQHPPLVSHPFQGFRSFDPSPATFAPAHFETQPSAGSFDPMDTTTTDHVSPPGTTTAHPASTVVLASTTLTDTEMHGQSPEVSFAPTVLGAPMVAPPTHGLPAPLMSERFRFHVTLNAPTAMVRSADEIPITYLNKGQAYSMSIMDNAPPASHLGPTRYRTAIRISFEDEQQRRRPAACWQLWKEGRGSNEAHQRGGRLQAVEYVEPNSATEESGGNGGGATAPLVTPPDIEIDRTSFDGFSIIWTATPGGSSDRCVSLRFNFLSTDFSHSKGVKGIPVRLCAKTEVLPSLPSPPSLEPAEVCYCKVKLFRDHGAERKLSNDVAHVKKTIDKLKQQIAQAETGMRDFGKRKRGGSSVNAAAASAAAAAAVAAGRPGKVPKHKRTWSMSSTSSSGNRAASIEEDLHLKLATMQDMFTSTRPVSVLHLRGDESDDPDLHPVALPGGEVPDLIRIGSNPEDQHWERRASGGTTSHTTATSSRLVSPVSSASGHGLRASGALQSPRQAPADWGLFQAIAPAALPSTTPQQLASPPDQPVKIPTVGSDDQAGLSQWIEALGVDSSYQPPPERAVKPVACFYIRPVDQGMQSEARYYRAVYLMQRTLNELVQGIALKLEIDPARIQRTIHPNKHSLNVLVDDDVVRELPEGQDMLVELASIQPAAITTFPTSSRKREWDSGATDAQVDGDIPTTHHPIDDTSELELKLIF